MPSDFAQKKNAQDMTEKTQAMEKVKLPYIRNGNFVPVCFIAYTLQ